MTIEELKVIIRGETSDLRKAVKDVKTQTADLTKEVKGTKKEINDLGKETKKSTESMSTSFKKVGAVIASVFSIGMIVNFIKECVSAASQMESAYIGLKSILDGQGRSFQGAYAFIQEYTKDGLIPATDAVIAYKNLAARGYNDSQIQAVMLRLKDSSAFGRASHLTMGEAVVTATEGLKNENSVLVDNAGVTKNVAKMWEDYGKSIGVSSVNLTQAQKVQAEVNGIMEETKYQVGDSMKVLDTYQGKLAGFQASLYNLKVAIGQAFIPLLSVVLPVLTAIVNAIRTVVVWVNAFVDVLFGRKSSGIVSDGDVSNSSALGDNLGSAADSADSLSSGTGTVGKNLGNANKSAKELKKNLMGFDEIHNLSGNSPTDSALGGSGGIGGAGGVGDLNTSGWDEWSDIAAGLDARIDGLSQKLEAIAPLLRIIAGIIGIISASALISFLIKGGSWKGLKNLISSLIVIDGKTGKVKKLGTAFAIIKAALKSMNPYVLIAVTAVVALSTIISKLWKSSESLRKTCAKVWKDIQNAIMKAGNGIWTKGIKPLIDELGLTADSFSELWKNYISPIMSWILEHIVKVLGAVIVKAIEFKAKVLTAFLNVVTGVVRIFKNIGQKVRTAIEGVLNIKDAIKEKWNDAVDWWDNKKAELKEAKAKMTFTAVKEKIFDTLRTQYNNIKDSNVVKTIKAKASDAFTRLRERWNALKDKTITIKAKVDGAIQNIKKLINDKIIKPINQNIITNLRKIPGLGKLPKIPLLARGGVVDTKTLFYAGEAGQEVVMPLENNTGWITKLAGLINSRIPSGQGGGGTDRPVEIVFQLGTMKFGKAVIKSINALQAQEGTVLINL